MSQGQTPQPRLRAYSQPNSEQYLPFCEINRRITRSSTTKLLAMAGKQGLDEHNEDNQETNKQTGKLSQEEKEKMGDPELLTPANWFRMFTELNSTLASLQTEITELKTIKGKVSTFSSEWKEAVDVELANIDNKSDKQSFKLKLLMNMMLNQEERIQNLEHRATMSYQREIKPNLIVHGIVEGKDETREELQEKMSKFFKEQMEIESAIELRDCFRMGQGSHRPVMIKLCYPNDKATIFANASKLQGKENIKKRLFFVHEDMTDEQAETRQQYRELNKENKLKDEEQQLTIKMKKGRIMVNNEVVKAKITPPTKADILRLDEVELEEVRAIKLVPGPSHMEKGNEFMSYAVKVKTLNQVRKAYTKIRVKHADALHISCGYRLDNPIGPYRQEAVDDRDCGMGRAILRSLKEQETNEMAVFIVRYYSGVHLGKRRFEIVEQLTGGVMQAWNTKQMKRLQRTQRQNSQTSLLSIASTVESQDDMSEGEQEETVD